VGLLETPPKLGIALVDRLLGGAGNTTALNRDLTEIETALLDQVVDVVLKEWCQIVTSLPAAKPAIVGHEANPRFLQTASSDTSLFVLTLELRLNDCAEKVHLGLPYSMLQAVIRTLNPSPELQKQTPPSPPMPVKWNPCLDSVPVPLSVEWDGLEIDARKLAHLKVGDVLPLAPERIERAAVRLARK
jgi:flagellar motor switch protein FliM